MADFYRTDEGQALLAEGLTEATLENSIAFLKDGVGAPLLEHWPELSARVEDDLGPEATARLTELFALDRIADIVDMEDVVKFEDESRRQVVVDALRKAST